MKEFLKRHPKFLHSPRTDSEELPDDLWTKCPDCKDLLYVRQVEKSLRVCPKCDHHFRLSAKERISQLLDEGTFQEWDNNLEPLDPLDFGHGNQSYLAKLDKAQTETGLKDAVFSGIGEIDGQVVIIAVCDFSFMGASMGAVYGEKVTRAAEQALEIRRPLLTVSASGGARMQEGAFSLMQMAKTASAIARLGEEGIPHISLLTDPCYGGVTASYASIADIIIAEPGAKIGFAGPRVIEAMTGHKPPHDLQTAENLFKLGRIDMIVRRRDLKKKLGALISFYSCEDSGAE